MAESCLQVKLLLIEQLQSGRSRQALKLDKCMLRLIIGCLTGHCHHRTYLDLARPQPSAANLLRKKEHQRTFFASVQTLMGLGIEILDLAF